MHIHPIHLDYFFKNRELDEIYISVAIRSFALSLISIFTPIYLLSLGFSLSSVFLFFALYHGVAMIMVIPAAFLASRWGFKHAMFLSVPFMVIFYLILHFMEQMPGLWALAAVIGGVMSILYWMGYHLDFSKASDKKNRGKELGFINIIRSSIHIVGPVVGGIIITLLGFSSLFVIVSLLLFASVIPLFFTPDIKSNIIFSLKDIFKGQRIGDTLSFMGLGLSSAAELVVWPLFAYMILDTYSGLGLVTTLSFGATVLVTYIAGNKTDISRRKTIKFGGIITSIIWVTRSFIWLPLHIFISDIVYGLARPFIRLPFEALYYDKANNKNIFSYTIFREIVLHGIRLAMFLVLALVVSYTVSFLGAGVGSLLMLFF